MTFTIYLIFTSLAGIILRSLFTTFCSFYTFCYYLSRKIHIFFVKHIVLHLMFYEFLSREKYFSYQPQLSSSFSAMCTTNFLKLKIVTGILWDLMFYEIPEVKNRFFNILHINCLLEFRKMTFKIYLIFTFLAGIILRSLFTTFQRWAIVLTINYYRSKFLLSLSIVLTFEKKIVEKHAKTMYELPKMDKKKCKLLIHHWDLAKMAIL